MLCNRCKKRMAVLFISRQENGKTIQEGLCFQCAKELNIPQVNDLAEKMGITDEDLESMNSALQDFFENGDFQPGGAETLNPFANGAQNPFEMEEPIQEPQNAAPGSPKAKARTKEEKKPKYKFLSQYATHLTKLARDGKMDRVVGRNKEIGRVIQILSRRTKNNPCLIGEPGVGKTAIAEGIAQQIAANHCPFRLSKKELYLLDMTALVAGTQFRGQFESRIKGLIQEVKQAGNVILFIDEIHTLVGTGDSEGSMSAANILKPTLSRGEIQVIGATTFDEYRKYIENDSALERRFQPVIVAEPTIEDTISILKGIQSYYETHHRVTIPYPVLRSAAILSERYITDRFLPDKAIDLLDEACACRSLRSKELTQYEQTQAKIDSLSAQLKELETETEKLDYERIAGIKSKISQLEEKRRELEPIISDIQVTHADLAKVIELWTGIPSKKVEQDDLQKLVDLEDKLQERIIGQDQAIAAVCAAIRRSRVQLSKRRRPASFIFVGPTGVGKTELVKVLAEALFDSVEPLIRLDMSEYMEKHAVSRLTGSPPGYVGYDDAGQLTEKVRRRPYSVILFDEIEKAHPDVMNILLQILDEGKITDSHGRTVNFENTVIVMTSNAGSSDRVGIVGFDKSDNQIESEKSNKGLKRFLRPEFLSRVDEVISFKKLAEPQLISIASLMLAELREVLTEKGISLQVEDAVLEYLVHQAKDGKYGARDLRKVIRKRIEDTIASILVQNCDRSISSLTISQGKDELIFILDGVEYNLSQLTPAPSSC